VRERRRDVPTYRSSDAMARTMPYDASRDKREAVDVTFGRPLHGVAMKIDAQDGDLEGAPSLRPRPVRRRRSRCAGSFLQAEPLQRFAKDHTARKSSPEPEILVRRDERVAGSAAPP